MAGEKEQSLSLVVRAVDKVSTPLRAMTAKIDRFTKPFQGLTKDLSKFGDAFSTLGFGAVARGFTGVGGAVKNVVGEAAALGAKLLALGGAAAFLAWSFVRSAVDVGDKLGELAARTGTTVDWFASMQHAAAQADVEQEQFNTALDKFNKELGNAKAGGGALLGFLQKVSPRLAEQVKGAKSTESAFALMTDAFKRIEDPSKRAALAAAAFGKSGLQMGEFLHQGSTEIQRQQLEYLRLAGSQEAFARSSGELDNAIREAETAFGGLRSTLAAALFPAFTKIAKAITEFLVKNRDGLAKWAERAGEAIDKWVSGGGIDRLVEGIGALIDTGRELLEAVGGWKPVLIGVGLVMAGPLLGAIAGLLPAIASLSVALLTTPFGLIVLALAGIAAGIYLVVKNWGLIKQTVSDLFTSLENLSAGLRKIVLGFVTWDLGMIFEGWFQSLEAFRGLLARVLALMQLLPGGGLLLDGLKATGVLDAVYGPPAGAAQVRQEIPGLQSTEQTSKVEVNFSNMPPGTRVTQDSRSAPVDLSLGYSMVTP